MFCDIPIITCVIHGKRGCVPEAFFSSFPHLITNFTYSYVPLSLEYCHHLVLNTFGGAPPSNPLHTYLVPSFLGPIPPLPFGVCPLGIGAFHVQ
jgi:hypothetical protein